MEGNTGRRKLASAIPANRPEGNTGFVLEQEDKWSIWTVVISRDANLRLYFTRDIYLSDCVSINVSFIKTISKTHWMELEVLQVLV